MQFRIARIKEGAIKLLVPDPTLYKLDSRAPVFYNPIMTLNRDISVLLLTVLQSKRKRPMTVLDLLAASGARGLRIAVELNGISSVILNDANPNAVELIRKNIELNKIKDVRVFNLNAARLLAKSESFDYIDIDPFGTPVQFLSPAIERLNPEGVLAVTATDTSALCGTYPSACKRKYGSKPLRNEFMHETGMRILIKKIQEVGAQCQIALTPIFCHSSAHYIRVYLRVKKGKGAASRIVMAQGYILYCPKCLFRKTKSALKNKEVCPNCHQSLLCAGKLWLGQLWESGLVRKMAKAAECAAVLRQTRNMLSNIKKEAKIECVGFHDSHALAKKYKLGAIKPLNKILVELECKGSRAARTHFSLTGIRTNARISEILRAVS